MALENVRCVRCLSDPKRAVSGPYPDLSKHSGDYITFRENGPVWASFSRYLQEPYEPHRLRSCYHWPVNGDSSSTSLPHHRILVKSRSSCASLAYPSATEDETPASPGTLRTCAAGCRNRCIRQLCSSATWDGVQPRPDPRPLNALRGR